MPEEDMVPRSRYDACNADWLQEKKRADDLKVRLGRACRALEYVLGFLKRDHANDVPGIRSLVERTEHMIEHECF